MGESRETVERGLMGACLLVHGVRFAQNWHVFARPALFHVHNNSQGKGACQNPNHVGCQLCCCPGVRADLGTSQPISTPVNPFTTAVPFFGTNYYLGFDWSVPQVLQKPRLPHSYTKELLTVTNYEHQLMIGFAVRSAVFCIRKNVRTMFIWKHAAV